jgi:mannose-6-phosphate isomerase-like protein (cupin superfamily)
MPEVSIDLQERRFVISRLNATNDAWYVGRAGMQYRDLIPGRLGGRVIASHIRIPDGGETPDYVHYHKALFQMIYCKAGWARLVYEDQGPPFAIEAGDCVLQPPEIRHRVLESSAGLEVIEVACPAEYETRADHELQLPTREVLPERIFGGQRFALHRASDVSWRPWRLDGFEARDIGVAAATNGLAAARVVKSDSAITATSGVRAGELLFLFILKGALGIDSRGQGNHQLMAGDSCVIPAGMEYTLRAGGGLEMLEVCLSDELSLSSSYPLKTCPRP